LPSTASRVAGGPPLGCCSEAGRTSFSLHKYAFGDACHLGNLRGARTSMGLRLLVQHTTHIHARTHAHTCPRPCTSPPTGKHIDTHSSSLKKKTHVEAHAQAHAHTHSSPLKTREHSTWIFSALGLLLTAKLRVKSVRSVLYSRKKNKMQTKQVEIARAIEYALVLERLEADVVLD